MRILLIVLFWTALGSTGLANVEDVYFCDEIQHMILNREGLSQEALDQFEFKVLEGMIEVEPGSSRFSNRKYFIEYMGSYDGNQFISAYDMATKFVLKNDKQLMITHIRYSDDALINIIADCDKIIETL